MLELISINKKFYCDRRPRYHQPKIHKVRGDMERKKGEKVQVKKKKISPKELNKAAKKSVSKFVLLRL